MSRVRYGRGKAAIELDQPDAQEILAGLRESMGPVIDELEKQAQELLAEVQETWPVATGRSKAGFSLVTTVEDGYTVSVDVLNDVDYARFIKSTKKGAKSDATRLRQPIKTDVIAPAKTAQKDLAKRLPEILAKYLQAK